MVIDSSVLIAILLGEPGADGLIQAISSDGRRFMSTLNLLETAIVIHGRKGGPGHRELDRLLAITSMTVVELKGRDNHCFQGTATSPPRPSPSKQTTKTATEFSIYTDTQHHEVRGSVTMSEDFDAPLPDDFWLGKES